MTEKPIMTSAALRAGPVIATAALALAAAMASRGSSDVPAAHLVSAVSAQTPQLQTPATASSTTAPACSPQPSGAAHRSVRRSDAERRVALVAAQSTTTVTTVEGVMVALQVEQAAVSISVTAPGTPPVTAYLVKPAATISLAGAISLNGIVEQWGGMAMIEITPAGITVQPIYSPWQITKPQYKQLRTFLTATGLLAADCPPAPSGTLPSGALA